MTTFFITFLIGFVCTSLVFKAVREAIDLGDPIVVILSGLNIIAAILLIVLWLHVNIR